MSFAEQAVFGLLGRSDDRNGHSTREAVKAAVARFESALANRGQPRGLATGIYDLDRITRGLRPGQLVVIGGRPSDGKSGLAGQIAERVAVDCKMPVGFWSLEMTRDEITRIICSRARVALDAADDGNLTEQEIQRISTASGAVAASPLHVYDRGGSVYGRLRRWPGEPTASTG